MASTLCTQCLAILHTNDSAYHAHHASPPALLASATARCSLCTILCDALRNSAWPAGTSFEGGKIAFHFYIENDHSTGRGVPTIFFVVEFLERDMNGALRWNGNRGTRERFEVYVPVLIVPAVDTNAVTPQGAPSRSTDSKESWDMVTYWLQQCVETHTTCCSNDRSRRLPTRLLDVGVCNSPTIRLHLTKGTSTSNLQYVTLSHCWGKNKITRLLEENLDQMKKTIRVNELPKTFQDAIAVTRKLGIQYLWIDSLCIIQDNKEDWARESSIMGLIYKNGYCNIAAAAASDGTQGCFQQRDPLLAQPCQVTLDRELKRFGLKTGLYDLVPHTLWGQGLSKAPLLKRGWVVQERVLARRVLHFGRNQLFWECQEMDACEMYPAGAPSVLAQSRRKNGVTGGTEYGFHSMNFKNLDPTSVRSEVQVRKTPWTFSVIPNLPSASHVDPYYVWNKLVIAYTRCGLTVAADKLVAISAIAKQVQEMTNDTYLAGLWRRHLQYHLMWAIKSLAARTRPPGPYIAPSWSWASMEAAIEPYVYIRPECPAMIQVLSASTIPRTSDAMGQIVDGRLQLRGWLRRFRVTTPKPTVELFKGPTVSDTVEFDESTPAGEHEVWFLPVIALGPWIAFEALGLLLESTGGKAEFRRVGMFRASGGIAMNYFRKPTYPLECEIDQVGGAHTTNAAELDNFGRNNRRWLRKKKIDVGKAWSERVITIV